MNRRSFLTLFGKVAAITAIPAKLLAKPESKPAVNKITWPDHKAKIADPFDEIFRAAQRQWNTGEKLNREWQMGNRETMADIQRKILRSAASK